MFRAAIAAIVLAFAVVAFAGPAFLIGLVYPSRRALAFCARHWARVILWGTGVRLTIEGREHLAEPPDHEREAQIPPRGGPYFFVGNHQSALDIPVLMAALDGDVRFMAKKSLFYIPIFGWALWRHGYVPVDRANVRASMRAIDRMLARLKRKAISFVVFPEGTRSKDGRLLPFRKGAIKICARSGLPVVPFSVVGTLAVHSPKTFRIRPGPVRLTFGKPIPAEEVAALSPGELHDRLRQQIARLLGQPLGSEGSGGTTQMAPEGDRFE